jgi:hypothetical protein
LAGLLTSAVLGFVIWLFGYITGYRAATSFLVVASICFGLLAGRQVYVTNPDEPEAKDPSLAELEHLSQDKALGKRTAWKSRNKN